MQEKKEPREVGFVEWDDIDDDEEDKYGFFLVVDWRDR
ncbi:hypothetical protein J2S04_002018 [Alicyclobacillus tengchongensis]|uniref:Uncharacterized protein n=2 Tax=Alicyclobacillus tolerans TaxID=90970 RepID=A0ABT9LXR6_9BACL|nr:hypothetical protein [Alicyclobacillus tengchongensis]SHK89802.1 hypothetical protein SAMN05443507_12617 [Alicyclobacillus montanus]